MIEKYGGGDGASMGTYFLQPYTNMHMSTELPAQNGLSEEAILYILTSFQVLHYSYCL